MQTFKLDCARYEKNEFVEYSEIVTVIKLHDHHFYATSERWGQSKVYPDARTAACQLAYAASASVRLVTEMITSKPPIRMSINKNSLGQHTIDILTPGGYSMMMFRYEDEFDHAFDYLVQRHGLEPAEAAKQLADVALRVVV